MKAKHGYHTPEFFLAHGMEKRLVKKHRILRGAQSHRFVLVLCRFVVLPCVALHSSYHNWNCRTYTVRPCNDLNIEKLLPISQVYVNRQPFVHVWFSHNQMHYQRMWTCMHAVLVSSGHLVIHGQYADMNFVAGWSDFMVQYIYTSPCMGLSGKDSANILDVVGLGLHCR